MLKKLNAIFSDWDKESEKYWLTIKDIYQLKEGDKIKVLVLDRNVLDTAYSINKPNKSYKPEIFFRNNYAIYTHKKDLQGKIKYSWQLEDENPYDFEFEIEYRIGFWYPLNNGKLPSKDFQNIYQLLDKEKNFKDFSLNTHIGWRGPMILWDNLPLMKDIYFL